MKFNTFKLAFAQFIAVSSSHTKQLPMKTPQTKDQLEALTFGLIESYEQNIGHIDADKRLGIQVDELGEVLILRFDWIYKDLPNEEPEQDKRLISFSKDQSLYYFVSEIEAAIREIDERAFIR